MNNQKACQRVTILTVDQDLSDKDYKALIRLVSDEKRDRIQRYHFYKDAQNALLADILARFEICGLAGLRNCELQFSENGHGKPFLLNVPHVQYNLSHSGKYLAFAVGSKPVGIDVEQIRPIDISIAERFFAREEAEFISKQPISIRLKTFYEIWTKKESRIKYDGRGLSMDLSSFCVLEAYNGAGGLWYHNIRGLMDDAVCHVCTEQEESPVHCCITLSAFLSNVLW